MLALFATLALTTTATSIPILPPLTLIPLNTTSPYGEPLTPWPQVPWVEPIDESASIAIEYYGRHVCSAADLSCQERVADGLDGIWQIVDREYAQGRGQVDSFVCAPVLLWFRQETTVPKVVVEDLVVVLKELMRRYGARELTHAGILSHGVLAATFELTIPGIEDE